MELYKKLNYPEGSLLFDVRYHRNPECFEVVYFSPLTQRLEVQYEEPMVDIWFLKEQYRGLKEHRRQVSQIEMDKCYPVLCRPSQISKVISEQIKGRWQEWYNNAKDQLNPYEIKKHMCECPWVFKGDFTPDVYFRLRWLKQYGDQCDVSIVTSAFLDIEVDVLDRTLDPKDFTTAPQPINAVTLILPHVNICAIFVLSPRPKNKMHPKFHDLLDRQTKAFEWLKNNKTEFINKVSRYDKENIEYLKGFDIRLHIFDFEEEIYMIQMVFEYINKYRPMFCFSWNAPFDDNYLMNRITYLGYDPKKLIIPQKFKTHMLYFSEDRSTNKTIKSSKDWFFSSTYSNYVCQMRLFAGMRKSQQERRSYSLSAIGKSVAKIDKLSDTKSGTFREFAYTDYINFLLYNVRDVVVQYAIESTCLDAQSFVARSYMFATQYSKCFQETHIVRNAREYYFEMEGFVQSCRLIVPAGLDTAYEGAFVADPANNAPTGFVLNGKQMSNIMFGVLDADAAAYYPSNKMGMNMDPMSLLYKCKIDNQLFVQHVCNNRSFNQDYIWHDSKHNPHPKDLTGPIINSYKNKNTASLLYNWFNVPSVTDYIEFLDAMLS